MKKNSYFRLPSNVVEQLADNFGTPLLILSLEQIEKNYFFLKKHMPRVKIHYAVKANPDKNILETIAYLGGNFDVASDGEINQLSDMGISGDRMLYANPFKTMGGLDACRSAGVSKFTFDSKSEALKLSQHYPGAKVLLRVRIYNSQAVIDLNKKFGADQEKALGLIEYASSLGLDVLGICFHVGSQTLSSEPYINALHKSREIFDQAKDMGYNLSVLDIGGGLPVPGIHDDVDVAQMLNEINDCIEELFEEKEIWSEPGRFICASAVNMLTKVIGVSERNCQTWYFLDEGVYGTFSGVLFDHWDYQLISYRDGQTITATFAGPSCDSLDVICCDRKTPRLEMDDLLLVPMCGAYSSASATTFNGFSKAKTIIWEQVKEAFNLSDLFFAPAV